MANYYTHISTMIDDPTVAEREWWKRVIELIELFRGDVVTEETYKNLLPDEVQIIQAVENDGSIYWGIHSVVDKNVWFSDEDGSPNLEGLANLIQIFHQRFRPQGIHTFRWSESCSKPRLDAYGGGVFAITAKEIRAMNVSQAEENAVRSFQRTGTISFEEE